MTRTLSFIPTGAVGLLAILAAAAPAAAQQPTGSAPAESHPAYTAGDVHFMTGMIGHHSQAVLIAGWAPTHGASPTMLALCERIVVGQNDEIRLMKRWLAVRHETIPDEHASHDMMPGMDMGSDKMMPGMLSAEQLAQLDQARGPEFDKLFLTFMIQHHRGALTMVDQLFGTQGAGEDEMTFRLASDIYADQSTEIERMTRMLAALSPGEKSP